MVKDEARKRKSEGPLSRDAVRRSLPGVPSSTCVRLLSAYLPALEGNPMSTRRMEMWRGIATAAAQDARTIAEKATAAGRDLTAEEKAAYDRHMTKGREALEEFKRAKSDVEILAEAKTLAAEVGEPVRVPAAGGFSGGSRRGSWAKTAADRMAKTMTMEVDGQHRSAGPRRNRHHHHV